MKAKFKTVLATITFLLFTSTLLVAQPERGEHPREVPKAERIQKMVDHLANELSLSKEQKTKVNALYVVHFEEMTAKQTKKKEANDLMNKSHDKIKNTFIASVKAELNADQIKKYEEFNQKHKPERIERGNEKAQRR